MYPKRIFPVVLLAACAGGCMSKQHADSIIADCPEYLAQNIGDVIVEPISPISIMAAGYVDEKEEGCPPHILLLGTRDTVLEEAFHSFEFRAALTRYSEWKRFYDDFHAVDNTTYEDYLGAPVVVLCMLVPLADRIPVPGKVDLYAASHHFEDTAACFVYLSTGDPNRRRDRILREKCKVVERFVTGYYRDENYDAAKTRLAAEPPPF